MQNGTAFQWGNAFFLPPEPEIAGCWCRSTEVTAECFTRLNVLRLGAAGSEIDDQGFLLMVFSKCVGEIWGWSWFDRPRPDSPSVGPAEMDGEGPGRYAAECFGWGPGERNTQTSDSRLRSTRGQGKRDEKSTYERKVKFGGKFTFRSWDRGKCPRNRGTGGKCTQSLESHTSKLVLREVPTRLVRSL